MFRITWRNLLARKVRLLLSGFAIVIGVAFVAGSLVFTDTISKSFDSVNKSGTPDAVARPTDSGSWEDAGTQVDNRTITVKKLNKLTKVDGVARADGTTESISLIVVGEN